MYYRQHAGTKRHARHKHSPNDKAGIGRKLKELNIDPELLEEMTDIQPLGCRNARQMAILRYDVLFFDSWCCYHFRDDHCWKSRKIRCQWQKHKQ